MNNSYISIIYMCYSYLMYIMSTSMQYVKDSYINNYGNHGG